MAKFYGKSSEHLVKKDLKNYVLSSGLVLVPLALIVIVLKVFTGTAALVAIVILAIVAVFLEPVTDLFGRRSRQYARGWDSEADIKAGLTKLPDNFSVFRDVQIGDNKGNLDFVVVGPPGIFILEVKSHSGEVGYNGVALTLNGRPFRDKDFFRQVHGQTWALKNYLKQAAGANPYIHGALVFSNPRARLHFGYTPVSNIYIIQKDYLPGLFDKFPPYNFQGSRDKIEAALMKTIKS